MIMKKILSFSLLALSAMNIQAQVIVDSVGNVGIGGSPTSFYKANIYSLNSGGLYINSGSTDGFSIISTQLQASADSTAALSFAAMASASGASNSNIALGGSVMIKGAAIYGNTESTSPVMSQAYAGMFRGKMHVTGTLQANQGITGGLLTPSVSFSNTPSTAALQDLENPEGVDQMFCGLKAKSLRYDTERKKHYSLMAEDVGKIFPDLVYVNDDGTKSINYVEMVPVLVQAINELSAKIETLEGGNGDVMMARKVATGVDATAANVQILSLGQNKPNPFSTTTSVEVSVPEDVQSAFIYVYDLTGKKVQQADITARGKQTVQLKAASLEEGMYLYSLIADGKMVETRRMIIEK